jgi:ABC-type sugar transport system permease subunit
MKTKSPHLFFILPVSCYILALVVYPIAFNVYLSLLNWSVANPNPTLIGIVNYLQLFSDNLFWLSLENTVKYAVIIAPSHLVIGLLLALALNLPAWENHKRLRNILLPLLVLPGPLAPISVGTIWKWAFDPAYSFLSRTPLQWIVEINWLGSMDLALFAVCFVEIWRGYPLAMLLLLGAVSTIPAELYEAAQIDGATTLRMFRNITLPLLRNAIILVTVLDTLWVLTSFDTILLLTGGGPNYSTLNLSLLVWMKGFENWEFSYAASLGTVTAIIFLSFSYLMVRRYQIGE